MDTLQARHTTFSTITPNLIVADMPRSVAFYRDVLGFAVDKTVPDEAPFVFAWMKRDETSVFLNAVEAVREEIPELASRPIGGTLGLFVVIKGIDALLARIDGKAPIVMPMRTTFYGMREFAVTDPDGYVLTFAEPVS
jgi:catechol 2,3-dioxygenase-like lactoylglutathione lyase family enzyme